MAHAHDLHLTWSYWEEFCSKVLGRALHHYPSSGGADEQAKYASLYSQTLDSYRRFFGTDAPPDIWPDVKTRFEDDTQFERVNRKQHWIIPKPNLRKLVLKTMLVVGLTATLSACAPVIGMTNPFDLPGPDFLQLYIGMVVVAVVAGLFVRSRPLPGEPTDLTTIPKLDLYELAYLNGGAELAADTAITKLVDSGVLKMVLDGTRLSVEGELPDNAHRIETAVYQSAKRMLIGDPLALRVSAEAVAGRVADRLEALWLIPNRTITFTQQIIPSVIVAAVALFGAIKIIVGLSRGRPVVYLVIACVITAFIAVIFSKQPLRTSLGKRLLNQLKTERSNLKSAEAVALFGAWTLALTPYSSLGKALHPPLSSSGGGDGGGDGGCACGCGV